jgi:hypothetical protein
MISTEAVREWAGVENPVEAGVARLSDGVLVTVGTASEVVVSPAGVVEVGSACASSSKSESESA